MKTINHFAKQNKKICLPLSWILYSLATVTLNPIRVVPGSTIGIACAVHYVWKTPIGAVNILLNVPILIICWKNLGFKTLIYTIGDIGMTAILVDLWNLYLPVPQLVSWVGAVVSGVVMGIGTEIMLFYGGTLGGTTAIAKMVCAKFLRINIGVLLCLADGTIVLSGALASKQVKALPCSMLFSIVCSVTIGLFDKLLQNSSGKAPLDLAPMGMRASQ